MNRLMAKHSSGKTTEEQMALATERDSWLDVETALEMGIIDKIIENR